MEVKCANYWRFSVDCAKLSFEGYSRYQPNDETTEFSLRAYTYEVSEYKRTAFNLSVSNASFRGKTRRMK